MTWEPTDCTLGGVEAGLSQLSNIRDWKVIYEGRRAFALMEKLVGPKDMAG